MVPVVGFSIRVECGLGIVYLLNSDLFKGFGE